LLHTNLQLTLKCNLKIWSIQGGPIYSSSGNLKVTLNLKHTDIRCLNHRRSGLRIPVVMYYVVFLSFGIGFGELGKPIKHLTLVVTSIELQGQEHWLGEISHSPLDHRTWLLGNGLSLVSSLLSNIKDINMMHASSSKN
jgi:hypothetical protein